MRNDLDFRMTDLEERLADPDGTIVQSDVLKKLSETGEKVGREIKNGLPSDEYQKAQTVHQALAAAHEIISIFPASKPE